MPCTRKDVVDRMFAAPEFRLPGSRPKLGILLLLFSSATVLLVGCGPGRGDLTGIVTYKGKALASGTVLVNTDEGVQACPIGLDGSYSFKNLVVGTLTFSVNSPDPRVNATLDRKDDAPKPPKPPPPPKDVVDKWVEIPAEYAEFSTSNLTYELKRGANQFELKLE